MFLRVSVTLTEKQNELIIERAKALGISKDKYIGGIISNYLEPKHNERGAGRKQQFGDAHKVAMKAYHVNGVSIREIAKIYGCSVGTVHKLINEQ